MRNYLLFLSLFLIISCSNEPLDGKWDDNIKLSEKKVQFDANENSVIITTQGKWWWLDSIALNNTNIDFSDVNTNFDNFSIEKSEFKIERINTTIIKIQMSENQSGNERILRITLEAGDYFDGIMVTQAAF